MNNWGCLVIAALVMLVLMFVATRPAERHADFCEAQQGVVVYSPEGRLCLKGVQVVE